MPGHGMRVRRNGADDLNPFTNMGRIIGRVNTNGVNGSINDAGLTTGIVEWTVVSLQPPSVVGAVIDAPEVSASGSTLTWTYKYGSSIANSIIVYWVR